MRRTRLGEGFVGDGPSAAHVNVVLGDRDGPVGGAWATALATPSAGHAPFMVVARPGLPVRPFTLFVSKATVAGGDHATLTWGAAQAGVAAGVLDAARSGVVAHDDAEGCVLIAAVWVDPTATAIDADAVAANNRAATLAALEAAMRGLPTVDQVMVDPEGVWNPFFRSTGG